MQVSRRHEALAWFSAALLAGVSLFGQSLHSLPGFGHGCGQGHDCSAVSGSDVARETESPHDCRHGAHGAHGRADTAGACAIRAATGASPTVGDGAECPICQFFASAKSPVVATPQVIGATVITAGVSAAGSVGYFAPPALLYDARAPPLPG